MKRLCSIVCCFLLLACDPGVQESTDDNPVLPESLSIEIPGPWAASVLERPSTTNLVAALSHNDNYFELWEVNAAREMELLGRWDENVGFHPDAIHWVKWTDSNGSDDALILVAEIPSTVQLWRMSDSEVFQEAIFTISQFTAKNAVAGDLNQDGLTDLVAGPYLDDALVVLRSNGDFTFDTLTLPAGLSPTNPSLVDWDQDGRLDIVWSAWKISQIILAHNTVSPSGDMEFILKRLGDEGRLISRMVVPVDLNGDDFPDLVVPIENEPMAKIYYNDGKGGIGDQAILPSPKPAGYLWVAADGDGPGTMLAMSTLNRIILAQQNATNQQWLFRSLPSEGFAHDLDFADVDGDGAQDLLVSIASVDRIDIIFGPLWERAEVWEVP